MRSGIFAFFAAVVAALVLTVGARAAAPDFDSCFADTTVLLNLRFSLAHGDAPVSITKAVRTAGWYGRRVNLDTLMYPSNLRFELRDAADSSLIFVSSKYLGIDSSAPFETSVRVPMPRRDATLSFAGFTFDFTHPVFECSLPLPSSIPDAASLPPLSCPIRSAAPGRNAVNIAVVAEGYTTAEREKFLADALRLDSALFAQDAFAPFADIFNIVAVMLPSPDSGISRPSKGLVVPSPLGAHFDSFALDRLITIPSPTALDNALLGIAYDHAIVLCNTPVYGGSGPYNDYCISYTGEPWACEVAIHEFGHSFARLGDEYESGYDGIIYPPGIEPVEPNITTLADGTAKWQDLIASGQASLIEGAGYQSTGVWRGCPDCLMRQLPARTFCPVCAAAIASTIRFLTTPLTN